MKVTVTLKAVSVGTEVNIEQTGRYSRHDPSRSLLPRMAGIFAQTGEARGTRD
jgi:hypothetical protein